MLTDTLAPPGLICCILIFVLDKQRPQRSLEFFIFRVSAALKGARSLPGLFSFIAIQCCRKASRSDHFINILSIFRIILHLDEQTAPVIQTAEICSAVDITLHSRCLFSSFISPETSSLPRGHRGSIFPPSEMRECHRNTPAPTADTHR